MTTGARAETVDDLDGGPGWCSSLPKAVQYGVGALLLALAVVVPLFRQAGTRSWQTIWAEDGTIYFQQADRRGPLAVMFRGYAGYLQLPPRLLGGISTYVPIRHLALYLALSSAVTAALLAWFVYWASAGWISSKPVRLALASLMVLMPALALENTATITNTIWVFAAAAPWALVSLQERPRAMALRSAVAFGAAASTAVVVVFLPLAIAYAFLRRTRASMVVTGVFSAGLALQLAVVLSTQGLSRSFGNHTFKLIDLVGIRIFAQYLIGDRGIRALWFDNGRVLVVMATTVFALIFAALFLGASRRSKSLAGALVGYALISFIVPIWGRGTDMTPLTQSEKLAIFGGRAATGTGQHYVAAGYRYSVIPIMMLASALAVLVASHRSSPATAGRTWQLIFVAHLAVLSILGFSVTNPRSSNPAWSSTVVRAYHQQCAGTSSERLVAIRSTFLFPITIRCRELAIAHPSGSRH